MPAMLLGQPLRMLFGLLEVLAELYQLGSLCPHRCILFRTISLGHDYMCRHLEPVGRQRDRLAMIAARGRDQSRQTMPITKELCRIDDRCARFERPDWGVVLVFNPHFATQALTQQRPNELRSGRHNLIHQLLRLFNLINRWQTRFLKDFCSHRSPVSAS